MIVYNPANYDVATSYISLDELRDICGKEIFINENLLPVDDLVCEKYLEAAKNIIDNKFSFIGNKLNKKQLTEFPRDFETYNEININVKTFVCYTVIQLIEDMSIYSQNFLLFSDSQVQREKLDVLEVEYFENKNKSSLTWTSKLNDYSMSLIKRFLRNKNSIELVRG